MTDEEGPCTLYVRHLPAQLPLEEREDLLRFFGARSVRCMSDSSHMKYSAFAVFPSPEMAAHALLELHQLEVLGSRLNATFSSRQFLHPAPVKLPKPKKEAEPETVTEEQLESIVPEDIDDLAPIHKLSYPINPKLMYSYPPPTVEILTNIANALASVPKFYVQVLHLMNKMNLPAPFGPMTQGPPVPSGVAVQPIQELDMEVSSSEESELESDNESEKRTPVSGPVKRSATGEKPIIKRRKLQKIISAPKTGKALKREEVFERPPVSEMHKVKSADSVTKEMKELDICTHKKDVRKFITLRELEKNRLSTRRMRKTTLYKNYEPGERNSFLIVENLHKDVPEAMITYVFGRYINWENEGESSAYSASLDRESRSCTVSFPSEDIAELALQETNGYKLMGEYMVVKFVEKLAEEKPVSPWRVEEGEKLEGEPKMSDEVVAADPTFIKAAFEATNDAPVDDLFGAEKTPPRIDRAVTPERTEITTPEPTSDTEATILNLEADDEMVDSEISQVQVQNAEKDSIVQDAGNSNVETVKDIVIEAKPLEPLLDLEELDDYEDSRYISLKELEKSRIIEEKMVNFKVFNNYTRGEDSNRLYIKNLNHKEVKEFEFVWLFGRFLKDKVADAGDVLDIKLMKDGRMRGQAFVSFPSVAEASAALNATNGYVLHGKPMVVQFGKQT